MRQRLLHLQIRSLIRAAHNGFTMNTFSDETIFREDVSGSDENLENPCRGTGRRCVRVLDSQQM